jgi:predicted Zn-dependent protease
MMKKTLLMMSIAISTWAYAQKSNVESAAIYLRNGEIPEAFEAIEKAAQHPDTKADPKMWYYRAVVFDSIYRNKEYKSLSNSVEENLVVSALQCLQTDVKKRYENYCSYAVINGAFASYNKAYEYLQAKDADNASKFFGYVLQVVPYDKNKDLVKNNINENNINLAIADMFLRNEQYSKARGPLQKLIDNNYNDPIVYILMANTFNIEGDTNTALTFIEKGRTLFPSDKDLIITELNIYLTQGKQLVLLQKLNEALEIDGENATLLYVRGNVYDNFAGSASKESKDLRDTANTLSRRAKKETVPANKTRFDNEAKRFNKLADSAITAHKTYTTKAEQDYLKAVSVNPDYLDAWYNLGALTNNKTTEIVDKMNNLNAPSQAEYDKKYAVMKKVQDSILTVAIGYFQKALTVAEMMPESNNDERKAKRQTLISLYFAMQQSYANMNDEKNTIEMMNKRRELEDM